MKLVAFFHLKEVRWSLHETTLARWRERFPQLEVVSVEDVDALPEVLPDADIFVGWRIPPEYFGAAHRLRWLHSASAGIEDCLFPELVASDVILTNSTGLHSVCIPEHVLGQMLVLARNFHEAQRLQERAEWNRFQVIAYASGMRELHGSKLAILGAGPIGANLTRLAGALGMRVRVMRRDPQRAVEGAEAVCGPERLHELLGWADFVVLSVPLTEETRARRRRAATMSSAPFSSTSRAAKSSMRRRWCSACAAAAWPVPRSMSSARSRYRRTIRSGRCTIWS
jgi:phosphoglycerate dehydrogenase-like enzyme